MHGSENPASLLPKPGTADAPRMAPVPGGQGRARFQPQTLYHASTAATVMTRLIAGPVLVLAIWSRVWLSPPLVLLACVAAVVLLWVPARLLPNLKGRFLWADRAAYGERIWINRLAIPVPLEENHTAMVLSLTSTVGFLVALIGAFFADPWLCGSGLLVGTATKLVYLHRMTRLYALMRHKHALYRFWTINPINDNRRKK